VATRYEILVAGELDDAASELFAGWEISSGGGLATITFRGRDELIEREREEH